MTEFLSLVNDVYIAHEVDFGGCSFAVICRDRTYIFVMMEIIAYLLSWCLRWHGFFTLSQLLTFLQEFSLI